MPGYSRSYKDYPLDELLKVARAFFIEGKTHFTIQNETGIGPREKLIAMCQAAKEAGMVRTEVIVPEVVAKDGPTTLRDLAAEVEAKYKQHKVKKCILVHGRVEMLHTLLPEDMKSSTVQRMARAAADLLDEELGAIKSPCLAVGHGYTMRMVADSIRPRLGLRRVGCVITANGVNKRELNRFAALTIARDIGRQYGYAFDWLPAPGHVGSGRVELEKIDMIAKVLKKLAEEVNIVLGGIGANVDDSPAKRLPSPMVGSFLGGPMFGPDGKAVEDEMGFLGMSLGNRRQLVERGQPVFLVAGADARRIPAIYVALKHQLANILISDSITARILIGEYRIDDDLVKRRLHLNDTQIRLLRSI